MSNLDPNDLIQRFRAGDRLALARLLTLVERGADPPDELAESGDGQTTVVGITGSGGSGKSTLIARLIEHLRGQGQTVAVLACDPQSPVSGGALLGDRIRVQFDPADEGIFFRSMSTRGAAGGVSQAAGSAVDLLKAFGFDAVLIETVGVGQDQAAVRPLVDRLVLLVTPNTGDEVQWEKAGVIELADVVVVHKADLPGADHVVAELQSALSLAPGGDVPPILPVSAATNEGIEALFAAIWR